jgi:hypothetical protein
MVEATREAGIDTIPTVVRSGTTTVARLYGFPLFPFTWPVRARSKSPSFALRQENKPASPSLSHTLDSRFLRSCLLLLICAVSSQSQRYHFNHHCFLATIVDLFCRFLHKSHHLNFIRALLVTTYRVSPLRHSKTIVGCEDTTNR